MKDKILLGIGALLVLLALVKPDISGFISGGGSSSNSVYVQTIDKESQSLVKPIIQALKNGPSNRKEDGKKLASLFSDIATLIEIDGDDLVINNTEEIKQANIIAGKMLKLDLKNRYPDLGTECTKYLQSVIGDDNIPLDTSLRAKSAQAFRGIAWACYEGSK